MQAQPLQPGLQNCSRGPLVRGTKLWIAAEMLWSKVGAARPCVEGTWKELVASVLVSPQPFSALGSSFGVSWLRETKCRTEVMCWVSAFQEPSPNFLGAAWLSPGEPAGTLLPELPAPCHHSSKASAFIPSFQHPGFWLCTL